MSVAGPGEVLVPASVREIVSGAGITFAEHGVHRLKGLEGEFRLFQRDGGGRRGGRSLRSRSRKRPSAGARSSPSGAKRATRDPDRDRGGRVAVGRGDRALRYRAGARRGLGPRPRSRATPWLPSRSRRAGSAGGSRSAWRGGSTRSSRTSISRSPPAKGACGSSVPHAFSTSIRTTTRSARRCSTSGSRTPRRSRPVPTPSGCSRLGRSTRCIRGRPRLRRSWSSRLRRGS